MKNPFVLILSILALISPALLPAEDKPNFVVIFCDDLGYNDIGPFGSELHRTPHLDRMAEEGRKFTSFYSTSPVCTPSRASLMTGSYPKRVGLHTNEHGAWVLFPGNQRGLNPDEITIADLLREEGYATACIGKWHLGDQPEFLPTRQGFDHYYGVPFSNDMGQTDRPAGKFPPLPLLRDEEVIEGEPDQRYLTQNYTREAISFLRENQDRPFFLYLPHTMPHWPQYSSPDFEGRSANGAWGDTVEEIDWSTGQILAELENLGLDDNTLVLFTSDNGGALRHGASNDPLSGGKGSTMEGGQRIPMVVRWPGRIPAGTECDEIATTMDLLPTFAELAGASAPSDRIVDGHDIRPLLFGDPDADSPYDAFYYYLRGDLEAVRSGPWKLHLARIEDGRKLPPRLYHLGRDIAESQDVSAAHPEEVDRLQALAERARADLGDDLADREGANLREPGHVEDAVTLTEKEPRESD